MNTVSRPISRVWVLLFAATLATGAVACGDEGDAPAASQTPTETAASPTPAPATPSPAPTVAPTPTPTPMVEAVPEGWERHATAHIQIDIPETWEAYDLTEESIEAIREELTSIDPEFASVVEQFDPETLELYAFDTESMEFATNLQIYRAEHPLPATVDTAISRIEKTYTDTGVNVLSIDLGLTIGGLDGGSIESLSVFDSDEYRELLYVVQAEPNLQFLLTFGTGTGAFDALEPQFKQVAESFRVL